MSARPAIEPDESAAQEGFHRRRGTIGLWLAPVVFVTLLLLPFDLPGPAHRMAAVFGTVVVLWVTEALPLAVSALLVPVLAVILQVAPARQALAAFADPIIFVFIGSFILAKAMFVHGLDRRIAYSALSMRGVGTSAGRILILYAAVCTGLSMWISNTATTAMMFPIGLAIIAQLQRTAGAQSQQLAKYAMTMMLASAFGASIGGMGTPIGTPPNLIGIGLLERAAAVEVSFFDWMILGVPAMAAIFAFMIVQFHLKGARGLSIGGEGTDLVRRELARLGRFSRGERNALIAFATTVLLWVAPALFAVAGAEGTALARAYAASMPEGIAALTGALLLFALPVDWSARRFTLTWQDASRIDWGVVLLIGGGLAMGELIFSSGLANALAEAIVSRLPSHSTIALTMLFTAASIVLSEAASNTASANMVVPIAIAVSQAAGVSPVEPALGATFGASMGFMMPISTAPNAIAYSSGYIPIGQMIRHGIILDIVGFIVIVSFVLTLSRLVI